MLKLMNSNDHTAVFILLASGCQPICETELSVVRIRLMVTITLYLHLHRSCINLHAPSPVQIYKDAGYSGNPEEKKAIRSIEWWLSVSYVAHTGALTRMQMDIPRAMHYLV